MRTFVLLSIVMFFIASCPGTEVRSNPIKPKIRDTGGGGGGTALKDGNALNFAYNKATVFKTQQRFTQAAAEEKSNAEDTRAIEYSVSGTGASIDKASGEVSVSENGTLTVHATKKANQDYKESKASYTLIVSDPKLVKPVFTASNTAWGTEIRFLKMPNHSYALKDATTGASVDTTTSDKEGIITAQKKVDDVVVVATFTAEDKSTQTQESDAVAFVRQKGTANPPKFKVTAAPWGTDIAFTPEAGHSYALKEPKPTGVTINTTTGKVSATTGPAQNVVVVATRKADEKYEEASVESEPLTFDKQPGKAATKPSFKSTTGPWGTDMEFTPDAEHSYALKEPIPAGVTIDEGNGKVSATTGPAQDVVVVATRKADEKYKASSVDSEPLTFTKTWVVTTIAGGGSAGLSTSVAGTQAQFNEPRGMDLSSDGATLYVVDSGNNSVRAISTASPHTVTTIAGDGTAGYADDAAGTKAKFSNPIDITRHGDIMYLVDGDNHRIRTISTTAPYEVKTIAGDGSKDNNAANLNGNGEAAKIPYPYGISVSPDGAAVYFSDRVGLRKLNTTSPYAVSTIPVASVTGKVEVLNSSFQVVERTVTFDFWGMHGMVVGQNNTSLYFVAPYEHAVAMLSGINASTPTTTLITGGGTNTPREFNSPKDVALSPDGATLYVPDTYKDRIRAISTTAPYTITTLAGRDTSKWLSSRYFTGNKDGNDAHARFNAPQGIAVAQDGKTIYVSDTGNNTIRKMEYR